MSFPRGVPSALLNTLYALLWLEASGYKGVTRATLGIILDKTPRGVDYAVRMGLEAGLIDRVTLNQRTVVYPSKAVRTFAAELLLKGKPHNGNER